MRTIGIRHRVKKTAAGEARPTQVVIFDGESVQARDLETEQDELDFVHGHFPIEWRKVAEHESLSDFRPHHVKWRKLRKGESTDGIPPAHLRRQGRDMYRADRVPARYEGLAQGDKVAMILGGSGDSFAGALARRGMQIGARVFRIPPFHFQEQRDSDDKNLDAKRLAELLQEKQELFYEAAGDRDLALIQVRERYRARVDAMKERIACEQRLRARIIGELFRGDDYPEGTVEEEFDRQKANDVILQALLKEESRRDSELIKSLDRLDLYHKLFKPVQGLGPMQSARLFAAIIDFRRFIVEPDPERMRQLYEESQRLEQEGRLEADIGKVEDRITKATTPFQVLQMVRSWKRRIGKHAQASLLDRAIQCHEERARLRHKAKQQTAAKLRRYCGVHVLSDGTFPRRRRGQVANWHPDARQGLYLLGDQFGMYRANSGSEWSEFFKLAKIHFRGRHPEPETIDGKQRYTDAHIFKMARWRTLTQFVSQMAQAYLALERGEKISGIHPPKRVAAEGQAVA